MIQAESGSGEVTPHGSYPRRGQRLRDFGLTAASGQHIQVSDYRGLRNLVLVFGGDTENNPGLGLWSDIAHRYAEFVEEQAEVLVVLAGTQAQAELILKQQQLPFPLLVDPGGEVHRSVGAVEKGSRPATAVYVTDRYGEVFAAFRRLDKQAMPKAGEILEWLEFINMQCPECFPPEWPAA